MIRFVITRVLRTLAVAVVVTFVTFAMVYGNAKGIARGVLGLAATDAQVDREVVRLGLDQALPVQYGHWLLGVLHGDLGRSFFTSQSVDSVLATRVPVTLSLVIATLVLAVVISALVGVAAAVYGGWPDRVLQLLSLLGTAIPNFIVAIVLVFVFAIAIRLFPATGYVPPSEDVGGSVASLVLPVLAILVGAVGSAAAQFRGAVKDVLGRDFVRTLRARGMSEPVVVFRHVLRNAAVPGLTALSLQTIGLLGGAVIIEQVFALPGMGVLASTAAQQGDIPVVMGCVLVTVLVVAIVNLLSDLLNAAINPRARTR